MDNDELIQKGLEDRASPSPLRPRPRASRPIDTVQFALIVGLAVWVFLLSQGNGETASQAETTAQSAQGQATANESRVKDAGTKARDAEKTAGVARRQVIRLTERIYGKGSPGARGESGDAGNEGRVGPAPSRADIAAAVTAYCETFACRGPAGPAGAEGPLGPPGPFGPAGLPATDQQVAQAIASYCALRDQCRGGQGPKGDTGEKGDAGEKGDTGDTGPAGPPGADGAPGSPGAPGANPTDEQIAAAVAAYCAANGCGTPAAGPTPTPDASTTP
ncbi:unannotated protein [freshwater metagenome]|uniref:Unannotated protein n=1 Tax=freshwater metagenome TaxID=449393 RepID=A0A6J7FLA3_9ZZZZ|nr:hypothetical protein [Actinomycetota bacterium]